MSLLVPPNKKGKLWIRDLVWSMGKDEPPRLVGVRAGWEKWVLRVGSCSFSNGFWDSMMGPWGDPKFWGGRGQVSHLALLVSEGSWVLGGTEAEPCLAPAPEVRGGQWDPRCLGWEHRLSRAVLGWPCRCSMSPRKSRRCSAC